MTDNPKFQQGDVVDIVFRRAVVDEVHKDGRLRILHTDQEFPGFDVNAIDVEVAVVGYVERDEFGYDVSCMTRGGGA